MLHLNRWNQYQLNIDERVYTHQQIKARSKRVLKLIKSNDILNIHGQNPFANDHCIDVLKYTKHNKIHTKVWMSQWIKGIDHDSISYLADELIIWCPAATKADFNQISGRDYFDFFYSTLNKMKIKKILSFTVRPMSIEDLPEFYDLVIFSGACGLILFIKKEFTKEELKYIKRFKRIDRIQLIEINDLEVNHCLSMPNNIGTLKYEWQDWKYNVIQSFKSIPIIKYIFA